MQWIHKVSKPKPHEFNHVVGIDVLDIKDAAGTRYGFLNTACYGTTYQQAFVVRDTEQRFTKQRSMSTSICTWMDKMGRMAKSDLM